MKKVFGKTARSSRKPRDPALVIREFLAVLERLRPALRNGAAVAPGAVRQRP